MRPFGSRSDCKALQLVQRGTDKRIPVELVKQPSGEVLDPAELEGLHVMVSSESVGGIATIPHSVEDGRLVVEVTADISRLLGLGVYTLIVTGRTPDKDYADGYHDYEIVAPLCKVTKYGSNETPVKVLANVLEGLKGKDGADAYELAKSEGYEGSLTEWLASLKGADGDNAYKVAVRNGYVGNEQAWLASLRGSDGKDAYELAKAGGYQGSQTDWIASLKGKDGKNAYELAKEAQSFTGTLTDYLTSLKGAKGDKGDDAYQVYLNTTDDNPKLSEEEWADPQGVIVELLKQL